MWKTPELKKLRKKPRCLPWEVKLFGGVHGRRGALSVGDTRKAGGVVSALLAPCGPSSQLGAAAGPGLVFTVRFLCCCCWWGFVRPSRRCGRLARRTRGLALKGHKSLDRSAFGVGDVPLWPWGSAGRGGGGAAGVDWPEARPLSRRCAENVPRLSLLKDHHECGSSGGTCVFPRGPRAVSSPGGPRGGPAACSLAELRSPQLWDGGSPGISPRF